MGLHSRLRTRIAVVVAAGALLVAAGVALLLINTVALRNSAQSTTRGDRYLLRVVNLERLVVDAETGLRGEIITGRTLFLQPLYGAQSQLPGAISALQQSAAASHIYQRQSAELIAAVRSYMSGYVQHLLAMAAHDLAAARSFPVTLEGKQLVDGIRARAAQLEGLLSASQVARQRSASATANRSIAEAIAVLVLLTLLTAALGGYLGHLVVTRERARKHSEETTRTLQTSILPKVVPTIPGCELATRFFPGAGPVSGDFYEVLEIEPTVWALMIGDVCGKGPAAAAATAMARWTLRSSLALGATVDEALRFLNEVVLRHERGDRFITAACLKLTLGPEHADVKIACAGHPAPILVPRVGEPEVVAANGSLLGVMQAIRLQTAEVQLRSGDSLVAYTDGITDQGPEVRASPEEALRSRAEGADADQLAGILEHLAQVPAGRNVDDIAILALRFLPQDIDAPELALTADSGEATRRT